MRKRPNTEFPWERELHEFKEELLIVTTIVSMLGCGSISKLCVLCV